MNRFTVLILLGTSPAAIRRAGDFRVIRKTEERKGGVPAEIMVGRTFFYIVHVVNLGPDSAANVMFVDLLDELVQLNFEPPGCPRQGRRIACNLGTIEPGAEKTVDIMVTASSPTSPIVNAASAQGAGTNLTTAVHFGFPRPRVNLVQFFPPPQPSQPPQM